MKKLLAILLALMLVLSLAACGSKSDDKADENADAAVTDDAEKASDDAQTSDETPANTDFKAGFIFLHDENSTYDNNFIEAAKAACEELGIEYVLKTNIPEDSTCYETAADLADEGCDFIFADSFSHEDYMIQAAQEYPEVQFAHATGFKAHTAGLSNYHNAFASIYEGRYLAGVAAGLKLNEMIEAGQFTAEQAKMGYVGAYTYAEVVSGYTSFYLGAKSVCPTVTMEVQFTGSWYDEAAEKEAATQLIQNGCKLISQHADSMGAPTACETAGIPNVSYNGSTVDACPKTFIVSSKIDWTPYLKYAISAAMKGEAFDTDYVGTLATGSVVLTDVNEAAAAEGTAAAIEEAKAGLENGTIHVFDTSTFTVDGKEVTTVTVEDTNEVVKDGYFHESDFRSAPYFELRIDGITLLNEKF